MTATAVILDPGEVLGGFRIADVIGVGGMAIVYRARQTSLDREVALKVLSPELARDETFSERFRAEGMHAARLDHPNVIPVYDAGEDQGRLYLAMRLVEGMSLAERMRVKPLTAEETLDILRPIAEGLDAAHAIGLIHRDVKPQNILLTDGGHPYLADFGVAKGVESAGLTASGGFVGTLNYAAPEQILGLDTLPATDVYALAAVLYHCLTGMVPYPRDTQAGLMFAQVNQSPPCVPLPEADEFNRVMQRGMAKDPEDRFTSAGELISAAREALGRLPMPHAARRPAFATDPAAATWSEGAPQTPRPARERPRPWMKRPIIALAAALVVAAAAVVVAVAALGGRAAAAPRLTAQSPPLAIAYSAPWQTTDSAFAAFALNFPRGPGAAAPIELGDGLASLAAGSLSRSTTVPGGPPPVLVSKYGRPNPARRPASPGAAVAVYRWTVSGVRNLDVWVIPTVRGDLAVICSAPVGMTGALRACDTMASRARVSGVARLPVGPDSKLASSVGAIVSTANASRDELARMYGGHSSRPAAVPTRLAGADQHAQRLLQKLTVPPRFNRAVAGLASGFGAEAQALTALSSATAKDDQRAYNSAHAIINTDGHNLSILTSDLRRDGLLPFGLSPLVVPKLPVSTGSASTGASTGAGTGSGGTLSTSSYTPLTSSSSGSQSTNDSTSTSKPSTTTKSGGPIH